MDFRALMNTTEYDFLRTNEHLGDRIMLLGLGSSYAYGTNNEGSDIGLGAVPPTSKNRLPAVTLEVCFEYLWEQIHCLL